MDEFASTGALAPYRVTKTHYDFGNGKVVEDPDCVHDYYCRRGALMNGAMRVLVNYKFLHENLLMDDIRLLAPEAVGWCPPRTTSRERAPGRPAGGVTTTTRIRWR